MFKPLDLQTTISHSMDIQRIQQAHQSRSVTDQPDFSQELLRSNQQKNQQIQHSDSSAQGNRIREEAANQEKERQRRLKPRRFQKKSGSSGEVEKTDVPIETERGQHIDIKI